MQKKNPCHEMIRCNLVEKSPPNVLLKLKVLLCPDQSCPKGSMVRKCTEKRGILARFITHLSGLAVCVREDGYAPKFVRTKVKYSFLIGWSRTVVA